MEYLIAEIDGQLKGDFNQMKVSGLIWMAMQILNECENKNLVKLLMSLNFGILEKC